MGEPHEIRSGVVRRSRQSRLGLSLRVLALGALLSSFISEHGFRWALLAVAAGLLLVPLAIRQKAPPVAGALWTAPADLIEANAQWPGQFSLMPNSVNWTASTYSRKHGQHDLNLPISSHASINLESGSALMDVFIDMVAPSGERRRFLTRRSVRLRRVLREIRTSEPS